MLQYYDIIFNQQQIVIKTKIIVTDIKTRSPSQQRESGWWMTCVLDYARDWYDTN